MASAGTATVQIQADLRKLRDDLSKAREDIQRLSTTTNSVASSIQNAFSAIKATAIIGTIGMISKKIIDAGIEFDKLKFKMNAISPDALKKVKEFSDKLPSTLENVSNDFIKLNRVGIKPTFEQMESLNGVSLALSDSIKDNLIKTLGEMGQTGKIESEKLRKLQEEGINVSEYIQNAFGGKTLEELKKSGVAAQEIVDSIWKGLNPEFNQYAKDAKESWQGLMEDFKKTIADAMTEISTSFVGDFMKDIMKAMLTGIKEIKNFLSYELGKGNRADIIQEEIEKQKAILKKNEELISTGLGKSKLTSNFGSSYGDAKTDETASIYYQYAVKDAEIARDKIKELREELKGMRGANVGFAQSIQDELSKLGEGYSKIGDKQINIFDETSKKIENKEKESDIKIKDIKEKNAKNLNLTLLNIMMDRMEEEKRIKDMDLAATANYTADWLKTVEEEEEKKRKLAEETSKRIEAIWNSMTNELQDTMSDFLTSALKGDFDNFEDIFKGFCDNLLKIFVDDFTSQLSKYLIDALKNSQIGNSISSMISAGIAGSTTGQVSAGATGGISAAGLSAIAIPIAALAIGISNSKKNSASDRREQALKQNNEILNNTMQNLIDSINKNTEAQSDSVFNDRIKTIENAYNQASKNVYGNITPNKEFGNLDKFIQEYITGAILNIDNLNKTPLFTKLFDAIDSGVTSNFKKILSEDEWIQFFIERQGYLGEKVDEAINATYIDLFKTNKENLQKTLEDEIKIREEANNRLRAAGELALGNIEYLQNKANPTNQTIQGKTAEEWNYLGLVWEEMAKELLNIGILTEDQANYFNQLVVFSKKALENSDELAVLNTKTATNTEETALNTDDLADIKKAAMSSLDIQEITLSYEQPKAALQKILDDLQSPEMQGVQSFEYYAKTWKDMITQYNAAASSGAPPEILNDLVSQMQSFIPGMLDFKNAYGSDWATMIKNVMESVNSFLQKMPSDFTTPSYTLDPNTGIATTTTMSNGPVSSDAPARESNQKLMTIAEILTSIEYNTRGSKAGTNDVRYTVNQFTRDSYAIRNMR